MHTLYATQMWANTTPLEKQLTVYARAAQDGSYFEKIDACKVVALLLADGFLAASISTQNSVDLFEIIEARESRCATVITSQLEPNERHLPSPTA